MIYQLKHPENGTIHVYDLGEVDRLAKWGWVRDEKQPEESPWHEKEPVESQKRRGRPPKG